MAASTAARRRQRALVHTGPLLLLAVLTCIWTWPLILHLRTHLPGEPGDNFSFVWNIWWMREVLATPGLTFLQSDRLFAPFGISLVNHSHTALAALAGATALGRFPPAVAENIIVLATVLLAAVAMYALAWDVTKDRSACVAAAIIFAGSPHMASKLAAGHLELASIWVFPLFALAFRRALGHHSKLAAIAAGAILAAAAYSAYYYVVYLLLFAASYLVAWSGWIGCRIVRRPQSQRTAWLGSLALVLLVGTLALALWIVLTGGTTLSFVSIRRPQNPLTVGWLLGLAWLLIRWRLVFRITRPRHIEIRALAWMMAIAGIVFVLGTLPLTRAAIGLRRQGGYSSQQYFWRSSPGGVDVVAPFLGNPFHPLMGNWSTRGYAWAHADRIEGIAWIGVVPILVLIAFRELPKDRAEQRVWWAVLGVSALWAAGPILTVAGFDTGLRLPQMLARFLPVVANARIPGRAMVLVYMALGILVAERVASAGSTRPQMSSGRAREWQRRVGWWLVPALLVADYFNAPIPLSRLDQPIAYQRLAEMHDGRPVCEVPFGIGDGLGGVGSQDRRPLYYATLHGHPLVGGFIGRFPAKYTELYSRMPLVGDMLHIWKGESSRTGPASASSLPCAYLVVHRDTASAALLGYLRSTLTLGRLAGDDVTELYRIDGMKLKDVN